MLGAKVCADGRPSRALVRRATFAAKVWRSSGGALGLVASGGGVGRYREAEWIRAIVVDLGVDPEVVVLEHRSTNTWENALECSRILRNRHWRNMLLVTDSYHMRRAVLLFRSFGLEPTPWPVPPDDQSSLWNRYQSIVRESLALPLSACKMARHRLFPADNV